jgi:polyisoprenoid-binding protein YceI
VEANIKVASIDTGIPDRDKDLRSSQFFDADKFPSITFSSSRLEKRANQLVAVGTLTMHGVSQEISLPITITGSFKNSRGFAARTTLNRRNYGMNWKHNAVANFVGNDIEVEIELLTSIPKETP